MPLLQVSPPLREKLGDAASESLTVMFADAHKQATESFERRLDARLEIEMSKLRLALSDLRFELLKWMFLFWVGQLVAFTGLLFAVVK